MTSWPERDDVILSQLSIDHFFTILITLISVLLNARCAFLICSAGRIATCSDNRALVLIDLHPHSQEVASALRQPASVHVVQLHDLKWPEYCVCFVLLPRIADLAIDREARTTLNKVLKVRLFWISSSEVCVFTKYAEPCMPRSPTAAQEQSPHEAKIVIHFHWVLTISF